MVNLCGLVLEKICAYSLGFWVRAEVLVISLVEAVQMLSSVYSEWGEKGVVHRSEGLMEVAEVMVAEVMEMAVNLVLKVVV